MLDKWAFGMSKIEGDAEPGSLGDKGLSTATAVTGKRADSSDLVAEVGNVSLDTRGGFVGRAAAGPSLLSQQAPLPVTSSSTRPMPMPPPATSPDIAGDPAGVSTSVMSIDRQSTTTTSTSSMLEGNERITVKIADLGNGGWRGLGSARKSDLFNSHLDGTPFYRRHSDQTVSLSGGHPRFQVGYKRRYLECSLRGECLR